MFWMLKIIPKNIFRMQKGEYYAVECGLWSQLPLGFSWALPLRSCLTLDKLLSLPEPQFPHL